MSPPRLVPAIALAAAVLTALGCAGPRIEEESIRTVGVADLSSGDTPGVVAEEVVGPVMIEEDETLPILVDVRHDSDWQEGHIEGALHIPISKLAGRLAEIDRERLVVLYCHSGMSSIDGSYILKRAGYPRVRSLAGGILGWREAGNAVQTA